MPSQLSLYNGALLMLGERKLQSLTENREARRLLDTVWERDVVRECLEKGQWRFALRTQEIEYTPSIEPPFGYQYAFDRPDDLVGTAAVCSDEYFREPLLDYQLEGAYWFADINPIYVRYVSDDEQFGRDYSLWASSFTRVVEATMAEAIVERITQDKEQWKIIRAKMKDYLTDAKSGDVMEEPTKFPPPGSWVRSRRGRRSALDRGSRTNLIG
jgi:hypothetical protein